MNKFENTHLFIDSFLKKYSKPIIDYSQYRFKANYFDEDSRHKLYGRESIIEALHRKFFEDGIPLVNVKAIGGQGKTMFTHQYKKKYKDDYGCIHHFDIEHSLYDDFIDNMLDAIFDNEFREIVDRQKIQKNKVDLIIDKLNEIYIPGKPNLLVLDINLEGQKKEFRIGFLNGFEKLKGKWHVIVLSRFSFDELQEDKKKEWIIDLPSFVDEKPIAREMFRAISGISENDCQDDQLDDIFSSIEYHPMLISVLATYCKHNNESKNKTPIRDYQSIKNAIKLSESEKLSFDMKHGVFDLNTVRAYINHLIAFEDYYEECQIIMRHFILWPYETIPIDIIKLLLSNYHISDLETHLNYLANDMVLTPSEEEYRFQGYKIEDVYDDAINSNLIPENVSFSDFLSQIRSSNVLESLKGFRMHKIMKETLRRKAKEIKFDYSPYLEKVRQILVRPYHHSDFKGCENCIFELLYSNDALEGKFNLTELLSIDEELYIFAFVWFFDASSVWKPFIFGGIDKVLSYDVAGKSLSETENVLEAMHDICVILYQIQELEADEDLKNFISKCLKKVIAIRKDLLINDINKLVVEILTYCRLSGDDNCLLVKECDYGLSLLSDNNLTNYEAKILKFQLLKVKSEITFLSKEEQLEIKELDRYLKNTILDCFCSMPLMIDVKKGHFFMGAQSDDDMNYNYDPDAFPYESPVHKVFLTTDFKIGKYPITQFQWDYVMWKIPSLSRVYYSRGLGANYPMYNISWNEAEVYCKLMGGSLPTEAQWEYAARGGHITTDIEKEKIKYCGPIDSDIEDVTWYLENSMATTHPVGSKNQPNILGLFDMSGNVWEWCEDAWDGSNNYSSTPTDGSANFSGSLRVLRGGSWLNNALLCRVSFRHWSLPAIRLNGGGFRLSLSSQQTKEKE